MNTKLIHDLKAIKQSSYFSSEVKDTVWLVPQDPNTPNETLCDFIDGMISEAGESHDAIDADNELLYCKKPII